jgi:hypothetical protein
MESFPTPHNIPDEEAPKSPTPESLPSVPASTPERKEIVALCTLEQENEFDDMWIAGAAAKHGYTVHTDETGRFLEKDGVTVKLKHLKFRSGSVQYHVTFTDTTNPDAKPSSFTFDYKKKFSVKPITSLFDTQLERYQKTRTPKIEPPASLSEYEMDAIREAMQPLDPEKQIVIDAYRSIIEKGVTDPLSLDNNDPAVISAEAQQNAWTTRMQTRLETAKKEHGASTAAWIEFQMTMFYLEAGFTDKKYAEEVLFDHAQQTLQNAEGTVSPQIMKKMIDEIKYYHQKLIPEYRWDYDAE